MTIVMNMSGYEIERDAEPADDYGDELLHAGWTPQLQLVSERLNEPLLPSGLAEVDVEAFLKRMYLYQR